MHAILKVIIGLGESKEPGNTSVSQIIPSADCIDSLDCAILKTDPFDIITVSNISAVSTII